MKKNSLKSCPNFADENSQQKTDLQRTANFGYDLSIGCNETEDYVEVSKHWAVKKFQSLQLTTSTLHPTLVWKCC